MTFLMVCRECRRTTAIEIVKVGPRYTDPNHYGFTTSPIEQCDCYRGNE